MSAITRNTILRLLGLSSTQLAGLDNLSSTELGLIDGLTVGTVTASKALTVDSNKDVATIRNLGMDGALTYKGSAANPLKVIEVTVAASALDSAGSVTVAAAGTGNQWKLRDIIVEAGGTNFGSGGDRNLVLQDSSGTNVLATIANAQLESLPANGMRLGGASQIQANKINDATVAGEAVVFKYSGGTTDHSATGSFTALVFLEKVA